MRSIVIIFAAAILCTSLAAGQQRPSKNNLVPSVPREDRFGNSLLKNASVSVRKLDIPSGSSVSVAASTRDYLVIALDASTITASGGSNSFDLELAEGGMQVMLGGWPHKLSNKKTAPARLLIVEIVRNIDPQHAICGLSAQDCREVRFGKSERGEYSQTALFETATTRLLRAELGPQSALQLHDDGRKHLIIPLTPFRGHTEQDKFTLTPGEVHWVDGGFGSLLNEDTTNARMLIVEVKN